MQEIYKKKNKLHVTKIRQLNIFCTLDNSQFENLVISVLINSKCGEFWNDDFKL